MAWSCLYGGVMNLFSSGWLLEVLGLAEVEPIGTAAITVGILAMILGIHFFPRLLGEMDRYCTFRPEQNTQLKNLQMNYASRVNQVS